jgi:hypothetical protein
VRNYMNSVRDEREEKRWQEHKNVQSLFVPTLAALIAILRPVEHQHPCPGLLHAYQLLKGGTIQLLALHERKSQPVELIVVLTQHRLRHLIALVEQALHL